VSRERIEELAALVAAGAATDEERGELAASVARDPAAAAELAAAEEVAAALALSLEPVAPPPGALAAIHARLGGEAPATRRPEPGSVGGEAGETGAIPIESRRRPRRWMAATAVALAAAAVFAFLWLSERDRARRELAGRDRAIDEIRRAADEEIARTRTALERREREGRELAARFAPLRTAELQLASFGGDGGGVAHVLADRNGRRWLVIASELPPIDADHDYQLWFVPDGGAPVSAGLLRPGPDGVLAATPELPAALAGHKVRPAISLEPRGGSPQPTEVKMVGEPI
jgi:anti-sigma-K factor RskA